MLYTAAELIGSQIETTDGRDGKVLDVWFDEESWKLRYLLCRMGNWLHGREVIVTMGRLGDLAQIDGAIAVSASSEVLANSPEVDNAIPISEEVELRLAKYWQWSSQHVRSALPKEVAATMEAEATRKDKAETEVETASRLRSVKEIRGYGIRGKDDEFGHVEDIVFEGSDWGLRFFVLDTRNWLPGRHVLLPLKCVEEVRWSQRNLLVRTTREQIASAPEYNGGGISDSQRRRIFSHFRCPDTR